MIIKKPFAFIVQKFKLLHFTILIPIIYLIYKYFNFGQFFNRFVVDGYITNINNAPDIYYSVLTVFASLLVIIFSILLTVLFKKKNKNYYPYLLLTLFYIVVFVFSVFSKGILINAVNANLSSSTSLIIRSLISIVFYGLIVSTFIIFMLAFGFDFRSGDFIDVKEEIYLDEEDSEEVEVNLGNDDYKFKRWVNRYIREVKYYVIENKNVFKVLGGILGVIILFFVGRYIISLSRIVRVDQSFSHSKINLTFKESMLTTLDYTGNTLREGKVYLAVKVVAKNTTNDLLNITTSDFCLEISKDNCIYPILDKSGKFIDVATPYYGEKIGQGKTYEYVLVYELEDTQIKGKYKIKVLDSLTYKENKVVANYKEVNLTPGYSDSVSSVKTYNVGDLIDFKKSTVGNTTLNIDKYEVTNVYRYTYDYCYKENCSKSMNNIQISGNSTLLVLDGNLSIDENAAYFKNVYAKTKFFEDFGVLKYKIGDKELYANLSDKTPKEVEGQIVLETTSKVTSASEIDLILTVRDKRYTIKLR